MTDVRLVATNPDDGVLVPVASNASGQLAVQSPKIEKIPNDLEVEGTVTADKFIGDGSSLSNLPSGTPPTPPFDGNLDGNLNVNGEGEFKGDLSIENSSYIRVRQKGDNSSTAIQLGPEGDAVFEGRVDCGSSTVNDVAIKAENNTTTATIYAQQFNDLGAVWSGRDKNNLETSHIDVSGAAKFNGDVVVGSRGRQWLIRESNGVAMLVEETTRQPRMKVRDLPRELDLIEAALNEVMEKLKMIPPAGWEVWDGSDNSR